jgi:hypothetical protein
MLPLSLSLSPISMPSKSELWRSNSSDLLSLLLSSLAFALTLALACLTKGANSLSSSKLESNLASSI